MTTSLNSHPLVAEILVARAEAISRNPEDEVIIIVAHGPTSDDENTLWLQEMAALARADEPGHRLLPNRVPDCPRRCA